MLKTSNKSNVNLYIEEAYTLSVNIGNLHKRPKRQWKVIMVRSFHTGETHQNKNGRG